MNMVATSFMTDGLPTPPPSAKMDYPTAKESVKTKPIPGNARAAQHHRHMWIITGPTGCGKSTIAQYLAQELSIPFIEGDDYHSESSKRKMSQGQPLTDDDRWDWLVQLREAATKRLSPSRSSQTKMHDGVVVTCSALKRRYRDTFRTATYWDKDVMVHFIFLKADEDILLARVKGRQGHFMQPTLVRSQVELIEEPDVQEQGKDVLEVNCGRSLPDVQREVLKTVREALADDQ